MWECIREKCSGIQIPIPYVFRDSGAHQVSGKTWLPCHWHYYFLGSSRKGLIQLCTVKLKDPNPLLSWVKENWILPWVFLPLFRLGSNVLRTKVLRSRWSTVFCVICCFNSQIHYEAKELLGPWRYSCR